MASIYSEAFAIEPLVAATPRLVWTVPSDGATYVVRSVGLWQNGAGAGALLAYDGAGVILCSMPTTGQNQGASFNMRQVLPGGTEVYALSVASGSVRISGYRLVS